MFSRKPSYPSRSPSPPSPAFASNLDSAFPPFRSRYDQPGSFSGQQNFMKPAPSPGAHVMQKMNGIADGPFSGQRGKPEDKAQAGSNQRRPSIDQYNPYAGIEEHMQLRRPSESEAVRPQISHPDRAIPISHEHESFIGGPRKVVNSIDMFLRDADEESSRTSNLISPDQRSKTFPEENSALQPNPYGGFSSPALSAAPTKTDPFSEAHRGAQEHRSTTSAETPRNAPAPKSRFDAFKDPDIHNPFIPASRQRAPSLETSRPEGGQLMPVTDANSPDQDPKSPWFEAPRPSPLPPSISGRARSKTQSRPNEPTAVERFLNNQSPAPPMPVQNLRREGSSTRSDVSHSPSDSGSSYASNSTAPSSPGFSLSRNASSDSSRGHRRALSRSNRPDPLPAPSIPAAKVPQPLESPIDPAVHHMRAPLDPAIQMGTSPRSLLSDSPPRPRQGSRADIYSAQPPRFQQPASKGECRGCGTNIYGKSVKAADGRLTGRYHRECFVCKTCQAPFPSAEFYVHGNAPYCAQHYHELNDSLCRKCNKGIEGQYLETDRKEKFHSHCFCCAHCRVKLDMDYYEVAGKPYCERHALAIPRQRGYGAPVAEKRRTRLGFM